MQLSRSRIELPHRCHTRTTGIPSCSPSGSASSCRAEGKGRFQSRVCSRILFWKVLFSWRYPWHFPWSCHFSGTKISASPTPPHLSSWPRMRRMPRQENRNSTLDSAPKLRSASSAGDTSLVFRCLLVQCVNLLAVSLLDYLTAEFQGRGQASVA